MYKTIAASLVILGLLAAAGCTTEKSGPRHRGCHTIGTHRTGRDGATHHHYAEPAVPVEKKAR